jgi:hypothetical protein
MNFFDRGSVKKLQALQRNVALAAKNGALDAGSFLVGKFQNQILNSPGTAAEGVQQPPHEPSAGRFVRRRTGRLVSSIKMKVDSEGTVTVFAQPGIAPYVDDVLAWSEAKYGRNFFDIGGKMYSAAIKRISIAEIERAVHAANDGKSYTYQNNFPIE